MMSREYTGLKRDIPLRYDTSRDEAVAILAVGNANEWREHGNQLHGDGRIVFAAFEDITEDVLDRLCPSVVLSPVLARSFDCIDLAQKLCALGYSGRYRAVSGDLPDPELVEREIRGLCPSLDFGILIGR